MSGVSRLKLLAIALKIALLLSSLCGSADAQVAKVTVKRCNGFSCVIDSGTCVNIGTRNGRAYFLTCGHVVSGSSSPLIQMNAGQVEARVEASDREPDLALLSIPDPQSDVFPVADDVSATSFEFVGFTYGRAWSRRQAHRARRNNGMLIATCPIDQGDSGGPFLDGNRRVVGIVFGVNGGEGYATDCITIRRWLMGRVGFVPGSLNSPQPPSKPAPPQSAPAPGPVACNCSAEIAALKADVAALKLQCSKPPAETPPPTAPVDPNIGKRLDELEARIAAMAELTKRIDQLEFKIAEVRLAGGKTEQLEKELARLRDLTFEVRSLAPDGKVVSSEKKKLGENIDLRLVPKRQ